MRARLVACEINKTGKEGACYASTPPGGSQKMRFSMYASRRNHRLPDGSTVHLRLSVSDTAKKYINGVPTRQIFMLLPAGCVPLRPAGSSAPSPLDHELPRCVAGVRPRRTARTSESIVEVCTRREADLWLAR